MAPLSPSTKSPLSKRAATFLSISSRAQLADWLGVSERKLLFVAYKLKDSEKYKEFKISKRNGGERTISAPIKALKFFQKQISLVLQEISPPRRIAKGYVTGRGIFDHAHQHRRKNNIVCSDIKDFFPSINFGRVRGMFISPPFSLDKNTATVVAQLCCRDGHLPQGSPTSPAISNIICRELDRRLLEFSRSRRITVSRYADDVCFSKNSKALPAGLTELIPQLGHVPGKEIQEIYEKCGFQLNLEKFKVIGSHSRQMVTGLVVNDGVTIPRSWRRQLRVILHIHRKLGEERGTDAVNSWTSPPASRRGSTASLTSLVRGKSSFAKHIDTKSGTNYIQSLYRGYPELREILPRVSPSFPVRIISEGHTDLIHIKSALDFYRDQLDLSRVSIRFHNYQSDQGDVDTLATLRRIAKVDVDELTIGFFDFDNQKLMKEVSLDAGTHVRLGKMVFAACLSRPPSISNGSFCIESLYAKSQASSITAEGRRLFFSEDFDASGKFSDGVLQREHPKKTSLVLSEKVYNPSNPSESLTLSKNEFANLVESNSPPFASMDFSGFLPTLLHLRKMIDEVMVTR